jgi:hypothetical protein
MLELAGPAGLGRSWPSSAPVFFPSLLVSSRAFSLLLVALDISFSAVWIGLLVVQASVFLSMSLEFFAFTDWSLGLLESCSPHVLTCIGLHDLLAKC